MVLGLLPQEGVANFTQSATLLTRYVTALLASPSSPPAAAPQLVNISQQAESPAAAPALAPGPAAPAPVSLVLVPAPSSEPFAASAPSPEPAAATVATTAAQLAAGVYSNWTVSCPVPAGYDPVVPAVLWSAPDPRNGSVASIGIAWAGSAAALPRVAVWDVSPPVGPTAGGTNIMIQVRARHFVGRIHSCCCHRCLLPSSGPM